MVEDVTARHTARKNALQFYTQMKLQISQTRRFSLTAAEQNKQSIRVFQTWKRKWKH
jgi:hypothetical protein